MKIVKDIRYNLEYWNGSKHIETVMYSVPKAVAIWKAKQLKMTTHKIGTFKYIQVK